MDKMEYLKSLIGVIYGALVGALTVTFMMAYWGC